MASSDRDPASLLTWLAAAVALAVALVLPAGYFALAYQAVDGELLTEAEVRASLINQGVVNDPNDWYLDQHRLEGLLSRVPPLKPLQQNVLVDESGKRLTQIGDKPPAPTVVQKAAIYDQGLRVGELRVVRSIRPLWHHTGVAAIVGVLLGGAVFVAFRVYPLRALHRATAALNSEVERHADARREAEAANRAKSQFLAAASHDLRQPLHALGLFAAVLEQKVDRAEARDLTRSINASVDALEQLFSAIMDISKLDAGVVHATISETPIHDLLDRVRAEFTEPARAKGISFKVRPAEGVVQTDAVLAQRILSNLVANAIRYTPRGGVLVGCRRRERTLRIDVWDTGVGIPATEVPRIFDEFYQVGNPERDRSKGMGLGLAIVRRLSALLDHRVNVRSTPGKGSCFSFELPLLRSESARSAARVNAPAERLQGKLLVMIDDEPAVREGMDLLLRQWGCSPVSCASLEEASTALDRLGRAPDAVIADYRLRGETGAQAITALRERFGAGLPAVIITGDIGADRLAEFAAQRYFYLHKPVPPMELRALLDSLFEGVSRAREALSPGQPA